MTLKNQVMTTAELLKRIYAFCNKTKLSRTAFGYQAMNDPAFIAKLEGGRQCFPGTAEKVLAFIEKGRA
jgi:hypothetical protein